MVEADEKRMKVHGVNIVDCSHIKQPAVAIEKNYPSL